jgi:hypothetical protein
MRDSEPVAWAVALGDEGMVLDGIYVSKAKADEVLEWRNENTEYGARLIPLYRSPTITDAEREAVERARQTLDAVQDLAPTATADDAMAAATLRGLLERTA